MGRIIRRLVVRMGGGRGGVSDCSCMVVVGCAGVVWLAIVAAQKGDECGSRREPRCGFMCVDTTRLSHLFDGSSQTVPGQCPYFESDSN